MALLVFDQWSPEERRWIEKIKEGGFDELEAIAKEVRSQNRVSVRFVRVCSRKPSLD